MKPNTRLLIRLTLQSGDMMGWGYDYPEYNDINKLQSEIQNDFADMPDNTEIRLFYYDNEHVVETSSSSDLAKKTIDWLLSTGHYNGN